MTKLQTINLRALAEETLRNCLNARGTIYINYLKKVNEQKRKKELSRSSQEKTRV